MKKFIYYIYALYIGIVLATFNPIKVHADTLSLPIDDFGDITAHWDTNEPIIKTDSVLIQFYATYKLINYFYPEDKINQDITPLLRMVWPEVKPEKLQNIAPFFKFCIISARKYNYATDKLKQKIKSFSVIPEDAPVIAEDGEFAPAYPDYKKETGDNEYKVSYTPYKYLGYDQSKEGDPVRRRDKNFEPVSENALTELSLGLLEFDLRRIIKAIKMMPKYNDGTREKEVDLGNGVSSRLLLDTAGLGDKETVRGVLNINVPKGWYINGDLLNPRVKPHFFLSEDKKEDLNIKQYQLYYPEAHGIESNKKQRRILINDVQFPITFTRRDITKGLNIKGSFTFELCQAKTDKCHPMISQNSLSIPPSDTENESMHLNYVTVAFNRLPREQTKHIKLKQALYDPNAQKLTITYNTNKNFSNVAAMAEDAAETNFTNPRFEINKDEISVTFDVNTNKSNSSFDDVKSITEGGEIAVTAAFDEKEVSRIIVTPKNAPHSSPIAPIKKADLSKAFWFGLLLNLMPGLFYMLQRLWQLIAERNDYKYIIFRYFIGIFAGLILLKMLTHTHPWYSMYENIGLIVTSFTIIISYEVSLAGYMDFSLFRPFKSKIRNGFFIGLLSVILMSVIPAPYKTATFNHIISLSPFDTFLTLLTFILGLLTLPVLYIPFRRKWYRMPNKIRNFNLIYNLFYLFILLFIAYNIKGWQILILLVITGIFIILLWYVYPIAIIETTKHTRRKTDKIALFKLVQTHAFIIIFVIIVTSSFIGYYIPTKDKILPKVSEIELKKEDTLNKGKTLLLMFSPPWSWTSFVNRLSTKELSVYGVEVLSYNTLSVQPQLKYWLDKYHKISPPLNILYTNRHPNGLVLPESLIHINWKEAVADFSFKNKKKEITDE